MTAISVELVINEVVTGCQPITKQQKPVFLTISLLNAQDEMKLDHSIELRTNHYYLYR